VTCSRLLIVLPLVVALAACASPPRERERPTGPQRLHDVPCAGPPGVACAPVLVGPLPFVHHGDTSSMPEGEWDRYGCAPAIDQAGPEVHYDVVVDTPSLLVAAVSPGRGVDVDLALLGAAAPDACVARGDRTLEAPVDVGVFRLVVDTHRGPALAGRYRLDVDLAPLVPEPVGTLWNTFYYLANEADHGAAADAPLYDASCELLGQVPQVFHDDLCIEGSGILADGRVLNFARGCTEDCFFALPCGRKRYKICYQELDPAQYPWGMGSRHRVLRPDVSIAVDPTVIPLGTALYLAELDGLVPPGRTEPLTGCVSADDVGGAIKGTHIDLFVGTRQRWRAWERLLPTRSRLTAYRSHPRCAVRPETGER
jgi:3D (Asp-Asp-Asp) domain-containing protein